MNEVSVDSYKVRVK